ncbi:helix-turn-helix domain-containing protein [Dyella choica]|uniref:AraC family transcriptional regulator n=1 Tax=Dyella choica TaxID=1927959 RepID=A0A3S0RLP3_9GAMM|nr:helix-turn-helix domain-containing protein [Dyella choica]RUL77550.1 AraC family transcriptional regulator [Dyella choica]
MRIAHRLPAPSLSLFVDRYWSWESDGGALLRLLPLMPSPGGLEIFFHYATPFAVGTDTQMQTLPHAHVVCVRSRPVELFQHGPLGFVAVRVRAGAGQRLTGMPTALLCDRFTDAADIWGPAVHTLLQQLAEAADMNVRAAILDRFLSARLQPAGQGVNVQHAISRLLQQALRVETLANEIGISTRHLENRFHDATGISPARFRRLARLRRSLRELLLAPPDSLLTELIDPAYFDQAQQVREFRELTGFSPGELRRAAPTYSHFYNRPWPR